jgi:hypothetical protein
MIIKIMGEENLPDNNGSKTFALHEAETVKFSRDQYGLNVTLVHKLPGDNNYQEVTYVATGNVYVMNNEGKTIESLSFK